MSKTDTYTQCRLRRANVEQTTYLPTDYAVVGDALQLKQPDGSWLDGWQVVHVGAVVAAPEVERHETDYCRQRKASDI